MLWIGIVIDCAKCGIMSNEAIIADEDAALILELTTHIDECTFANPSVLTAIRTKRREHANAIWNLIPSTFSEQFS